MNAPYSKRKTLTPYQLLSEEARLCFVVAAACLSIGLFASLVDRLVAVRTPLPTLTVVGAFYGLMGLTRLSKLPGASHGRDAIQSTPGH